MDLILFILKNGLIISLLQLIPCWTAKFIGAANNCLGVWSLTWESCESVVCVSIGWPERNRLIYLPLFMVSFWAFLYYSTCNINGNFHVAIVNLYVIVSYKFSREMKKKNECKQYLCEWNTAAVRLTIVIPHWKLMLLCMLLLLPGQIRVLL